MRVRDIIFGVLDTGVKIALVLAAVIIIYRGSNLAFDYGYRIFTEPAMSAGEGRTVTVTLKPDMSATEVGKMMEEKGLTRDATLFALQYLLSEYKEEVKPGTYEVSTAMTAEEIMAAMVPAQQAEETK